MNVNKSPTHIQFPLIIEGMKLYDSNHALIAVGDAMKFQMLINSIDNLTTAQDLLIRVLQEHKEGELSEDIDTFLWNTGAIKKTMLP